MKRSISLLAMSTLLAFPGLASAGTAKDALNWEIFWKLYPPRALAAREEGAVGFTVRIDSKGDVTRCNVTHSSGHPLLDDETCKIMVLHAQFNPDPGMSPSSERTHEGVIVWKLPASTTVVPPPTRLAAAAAPEKIICKKIVRIGTLSGFERTCMTPTEWSKQSDQMKEVYEELQGKKGSSHGD